MAWYYALHGVRKGPVTDMDFDLLLKSGKLTPRTLVWRPGMADWVKLENLQQAPEVPMMHPAVEARATGNIDWRGAKIKTSTVPVPAVPRTTTSLNLLASVPTQETPHPMVFTGSGWEFFRLWFVNRILILLSCGLYYPWAKVRERQFLHANTLLAGTPFEYTGKPLALLLGNIMLVASLVACSFAWKQSTSTFGVAVAVCAVVLPWFTRKVRRHAANSLHFRGLPFQFTGSLRDSFILHGLLLWLVPLTGGLLAPYVFHRHKSFFIGNLRYGDARFHFNGETSWFVALIFKVLAVVLSITLVVGILLLPTGLLLGMRLEDKLFQMIVAATAGGVALLCVPAFCKSQLTNYLLENTSIGPRCRLASNGMHALELLRLYISNFLAIVLSCGLATPWARLRLYRYELSCVCVLTTGGMDEVTVAAIPVGNVLHPETLVIHEGLEIGL